MTFDEALENLKPSLQMILRLLKEMSPNETVVQFGLKMGGETAMIIAKGTAEVKFTTPMSWKST